MWRMSNSATAAVSSPATTTVINFANESNSKENEEQCIDHSRFHHSAFALQLRALVRLENANSKKIVVFFWENSELLI